MSSQQTLSNIVFDVFGHQVNLMAMAFIVLVAGILFLFWRIQRSQKLDFADMITKDGQTVSLTKVLQLIGGLTATWIMIKLTLTGGLTDAILGIYLAYVGGVEGFSKYVTAKYQYKEFSVRQPAEARISSSDEFAENPSLKPPKD